MLGPGRIRDPVHGYIAFTGIERALLNHPVAQRLRYVSQSAAAHLVFPEMRVSRFAHSLGTMHLASRFLGACLSNAGEDERRFLLAGFKAVVENEQGLGLPPETAGILRRHGLRLGSHAGSDDERTILLLIEQGLRLASLVHDLGHLPFSHDFEIALNDFFRRHPEAAERYPELSSQSTLGTAPHEVLGFQLSYVLQEQVFGQQLASTPLSKPAEVALLVARRILETSAAPPELLASESELALSWLHQLIDGEVDVDRADYVLRDVRHYGLVGASYDLDRLIDFLTVVLVDDCPRTAILPQGVGPAEAFLVARSRMYSWAVYHHKVQQAAAGLREAICHVLGQSDPETSRFLQDLEAVAGGSPNPDDLASFASYDDVWLLGVMRTALRNNTPPEIEPWLALFVERRPGPVSLWKRPADFPCADRKAWNRRLPAPDDTPAQAAFEQVVENLRSRGVLVVRLRFAPWKSDSQGKSQLCVLDGDQLRPLSDLSSLVLALREAWLSEIQVMAFATAQDRVAPQQVIDELGSALQHEETK